MNSIQNERQDGAVCAHDPLPGHLLRPEQDWLRQSAAAHRILLLHANGPRCRHGERARTPALSLPPLTPAPADNVFLSVAATPPPPCRAAPSPHRRRCRPSWTHLMDGCATRSPACLRAGAQARAGGAVAGPELAARRHAGEGAAVRHRRLRPCSLSGCACCRICSPIAWARRASGAPGGARPHLSPMARGAGLAMCVATFDAYRSVAP